MPASESGTMGLGAISSKDTGGSESETLAGGWVSVGTDLTHLPGTYYNVHKDPPQRDVDHLEILAAGGGGDLAGTCADIVHNRILKSRQNRI